MIVSNAGETHVETAQTNRSETRRTTGRGGGRNGTGVRLRTRSNSTSRTRCLRRRRRSWSHSCRHVAEGVSRVTTRRRPTTVCGVLRTTLHRQEPQRFSIEETLTPACRRSPLPRAVIVYLVFLPSFHSSIFL